MWFMSKFSFLVFGYQYPNNKVDHWKYFVLFSNKYRIQTNKRKWVQNIRSSDSRNSNYLNWQKLLILFIYSIFSPPNAKEHLSLQIAFKVMRFGGKWLILRFSKKAQINWISTSVWRKTLGIFKSDNIVARYNFRNLQNCISFQL